MKIWKSKILYACLLLLTAGVLTSCGAVPDGPAGSADSVPVDMVASVTASPLPEPVPEKTAALPEIPDYPDNDTGTVLSSEDIAEMERKAFRLLCGTDGFLQHRMMKDPDGFGAEKKDEIFHLTGETGNAFCSEAQELLSQMDSASLKGISPEDSLKLSSVRYALSSACGFWEHLDHFQPFDPENGIQVMLPYLIATFRIEDEEDGQWLIRLLKSLPRFADELIDFENGRAEKGFCMTDEAFEQAIDAFKNLSRNYSQLSKAVKGNIDSSSLSRKSRSSVSKELQSAIKKEYVSAIKKIISGLETLRGKCKTVKTGASPEELRDYHEFRIKQAAGSSASLSDLTKELLKTADDVFVSFHTVRRGKDMGKLPDKFKLNGQLNELKRVFSSLSKEAPLKSVKEKKPGKGMEPFLNDFYFLRYPVDAQPDENVLFENSSKFDSTSYFRLVREYALASITAQCASRGDLVRQYELCTGDSSGWCDFVTEMVLLRQDTYDSNAVYCSFSEQLLYNTLIPACVSIYVNCYNYSTDQIKHTFERYLVDGYGVDYVLKTVENCKLSPYAAIQEGMWYSHLSTLMREMSGVLGEQYSDEVVFSKAMSLYPCDYDTMKENIYSWADELLSTGGTGD